jgi:TonB family protein
MLRALLVWTALFSLVCQLARSQDDPQAMTPPKLLAFVEAPYPDAARDAGVREAVVLLIVTIDADGFVEDVTLAGEPVGYGFDEAAIGAARRFVFEPARKGAEPMRARVQYRYDFELREQPAPAAPAAPEPAAAAPAPSGSLEINVREAADNKPLRDAEVLISSPTDPSLSLRLVTDERGKALQELLSAGKYQLRVSRRGYGGETHTEEVLPNQVTELTYRLSEQPSFEEYRAVARIKAPPREVTRRTIEREELTRVAGTRGDALRTIELLPGVARPPFGSGQVLIRGSAPQDSQVLLNGIPVPLLYHFGGLTSFINSRALERIDFFPGNFSVKYGRRMGGIIDVGTREPATDGYHGVLDMNVPLDSSLLVEGPITKKSSFLVAGRRSYLGNVLAATAPEDAFDAFAAPVYNDYQGFVSYRPTDRDRLRFAAYGSSDRLDVLFADAPDDAPQIRGIEFTTRFDRLQAGWQRRYNPRLDHNLELSFARDNLDFSAGPDLYLKVKNNVIYLRGELRYRINPSVQLAVGTDDAFDVRYEVHYQGPELDNDEGDAGGGGLPERNLARFNGTGTAYLPAVYVELALEPTRKLRIVPGLRLDYSSRNHMFTFDPRVSAVYSLTDSTRIKAGIGMFSQPPREQETAPGLGNPNVLSMSASHYGLGVDHNFTKDLSLGVEGFYKWIYRRIIVPETGEPPFTNDGTGRIYGLEVAGRKQASGRWFGFLSYTLMKSERKEPGQPWRAFDYDQRHILTLASTVLLGRGWEVGGTLRVITGNPRTPYTDVAPYAFDTGNYIAEIGRINSMRNPTFNRLDLRVQKTWTFDAWRLAWYLDIQNVYNAKNPEGITYSYDYSQSSVVRGLPIIPILGLRGEL